MAALRRELAGLKRFVQDLEVESAEALYRVDEYAKRYGSLRLPKPGGFLAALRAEEVGIPHGLAGEGRS